MEPVFYLNITLTRYLKMVPDVSALKNVVAQTTVKIAFIHKPDKV